MPHYTISGTPTKEIQLDWIAKLHKVEDRMTPFELSYVFEKLEVWIKRGIRLSDDQIYRLETIYARRTD